MKGLVLSMAAALVVALVLATLAAVPYGEEAAVGTFEILAPVGLAGVLAMYVVAARWGGTRSLRRRFALVALIVVAQAAAATLLFALRMFVNAHDAFLMTLVAVYAGTFGVWAARWTAHRAMRDVDAVREALVQVGEGSRQVTIDVTGDHEIARLAADVQAMVRRLDTEEQARRGLVAAVSHDLRTPITSLQLLAEAIDDEVVDTPTRREYAARMATHVRGLSALIDDLFELTRIETGDLTWSVERVSVEALVRDAVDAMRPVAEARAVRVSADVRPAQALANPEQVQRVLFNLIQNALRHTPADGTVTVRAAPDGDAVEVEVADSGSGIAEEDRAQVFEPFFRRADPSRTDGGAGLGLAIARAIVEAHGGHIWIADARRGACVRFRLPAVITG